MNINKSLSYLALLSGLSISAVAIHYSVSGLMSTFPGALTDIFVMGIILELSKLVATVWLKHNWNITPIVVRLYLIIAILALMVLTSIGIYGFLARAHLAQSASLGDIEDKIALIDDKIKIQEDSIISAKNSLIQLDSAVNQTMDRSTSEKGANRAIRVRKSQQSERESLQHTIQVAQDTVSKLKEEKSPAERALRKEKVEFGPITFIAALLYEDGDKNIENAVRCVIILIVIVFDPLAVIMLLCSQYSFNDIRKIKETPKEQIKIMPEPIIPTEPVLAEQDDDISSDILDDNYWQNLMDEMDSWDDLPEPDIDYPEDDILEQELETISEKESNDPILNEERLAKTKWKAENTTDTIKRQERFLNLGLIDKLPWRK